uniref:Uncharacterized protein n=1 Tax=Rhizophora mucronata TaxID=61149 RepID=A0A2P2PF40_RHIMU
MFSRGVKFVKCQISWISYQCYLMNHYHDITVYC